MTAPRNATIEVTPEADVERRWIAMAGIPRLVENAARLHGWSGDTLKGVRVFCVLNSMSQGERSRSPKRPATLACDGGRGSGPRPVTSAHHT